MQNPPDLLWLPLPSAEESEVLIERVAAPAIVQEGEPHRVRVVVRASEETEATLRVYRGSTPVAASKVQLLPDRANVFSFTQQIPPGTGVVLYRAQIESSTDTTPENNRASALVQTRGPPRVLLVDENPAQLQPLRTALEAAGMSVEVTGPAGLPGTASPRP